MRRCPAAGITAAITIACAATIPLATDVPLAKVEVPARSENRAAIAIRDDVTSFQKFGSREFTLPYLEHYYGKAWYFTLSGDQSQVKEFSTAVGLALKQYAAVDLYLLAHSNELIRWIEILPEADRRRLRLVYNTGCTDLKQGPEWLELGARAYVGHAGVSMSPVFYVYFLRRWTRGRDLDESVREGNRLAFQVFDTLGLVSFEALDAARLKADSEAVIFGDRSIRIDGSP